MKLSLNWINDFVDLKTVSLEKILEKLNTSICEIDGVMEYMPELKTIVAVKINSIEKHPQADRLRVCAVSDGKTTLQVVTNDQNVAAGDIVPLALPGTVLAGNEIKQAALKGVESSGMFCSVVELGLADESQRVLVLDKTVRPGISMQKHFAMEDTILDIDNKSITHRPDLWSHFGFARELAAQFGLKIRLNPFLTKPPKFSQKMKKVNVRSGKNANSYFASHISGIAIADSGVKIKSRLRRCGIRSINNVVDVSNYVMLEMGQPTHFFDASKLGKSAIEISFAKSGEKIALLDDSTRELKPEVLLIRNSGEPVAIAGVMGGSQSAVGDTTTEVVLESAVFKREDVRKSIRLTGIRSDSSVRYEKGLDSSSALPVLYRSLQLLAENGCGKIEAGVPSGFDNSKGKKVKIQTTVSFINSKLGTSLKPAEISGILKRLGFSVTGSEKLNITVPWYRHNYDVTIAEDIVEEVGRTAGYGKIKPDHLVFETRPPKRNLSRELERKTKQIFSLHLNYHEVFNYSFCSQQDLDFEGKQDGVKISNEMPQEYSWLRTSIYPSLLGNVSTNADRFDTVRVFETGRTYLGQKNSLPLESKWLGFAVLPFHSRAEETGIVERDFVQFRSEIETFFRKLGLADKLEFRSKTSTHFHPNCCLAIYCDGREAGELGIVHAKHTEQHHIKKRLFAGKIDLDVLREVSEKFSNASGYRAPSVYPQDKLDISVLLDETEPTHTFAESVKNAGIAEVEGVWVHDIYRSEALGEGKKSVTYRISLVNYNETFTQQKTKEITDKVMDLARERNLIIR